MKIRKLNKLEKLMSNLPKMNGIFSKFITKSRTFKFGLKNNSTGLLKWWLKYKTRHMIEVKLDLL